MQSWDRPRNKFIGSNLALMFIYFSSARKSSVLTGSWQHLQKSFGYKWEYFQKSFPLHHSGAIVQHWFRERGAFSWLNCQHLSVLCLRRWWSWRSAIKFRHFEYLTSLRYLRFLISSRVYSAFDTNAWGSSVLMGINNKMDP